MDRLQRRLASLTGDLLASDLPLLAGAEAASVGRETALHLTSLPDGTRAGVWVAQGVVSVAAGVLGGRPYSCMTLQARGEVVARLAAGRLPLVAEYFRLVRGVALVLHHEVAR